MNGLNKVQLIGVIGKDPETRDVNGSKVSSFTVATGEVYKDKNTGERKENTEWHRIICWNKTAETVQNYLSKGKRIYIEGKLKTRSYKDNAGVERKVTEIEAQHLIMLDPPKGQQQPAQQYQQQAPQQQYYQTQQPSAQNPQYGQTWQSDSPFDDTNPLQQQMDVPF